MTKDSRTTTWSIGAALRPLSSSYRRLVRAELARRGLPVNGTLNPARRLVLEGAIFAVQNDLERRSPKDPQVAAMNSVRNVLLDEVPDGHGGNHTRPALRWSAVERTAAVMHERRRKGRADATFPLVRIDTERSASDDMSGNARRDVQGGQ